MHSTRKALIGRMKNLLDPGAATGCSMNQYQSKEAETMNDSSTEPCCEQARAPAEPDDTAIGRMQKLVAAGGILGAIAASSCCIAPLVLFSLGISGA